MIVSLASGGTFTDSTDTPGRCLQRRPGGGSQMGDGAVATDVARKESLIKRSTVGGIAGARTFSHFSLHAGLSRITTNGESDANEARSVHALPSSDTSSPGSPAARFGDRRAIAQLVTAESATRPHNAFIMTTPPRSDFCAYDASDRTPKTPREC
jgi:hypothetical protein